MLLRWDVVIAIPTCFRWKHKVEITFIEETSTKFLCGPRRFLLVHWMNPWYLLVHPVLRIFTHPGSRILDLGSWISDPGSRISDPGSKNSNERQGCNKIYCHTFFWSHKVHKIDLFFIFEMSKKKIWTNFQRIIELFTQKIVTKLSKIWVWDPGSEIRDSGSGKNLFRILDPGVKKAPNPGSGSATLSPSF